MKKFYLLTKTLLVMALLCVGANASAQGTWTAPEVPGVNPLELQSTDEVYLYNIGADAFVNYGMNWNTQATATRLMTGDEAASGRHLLKVAVQDGGTTIKMSLKDKSDKTIFCGNGTTNDIWTDNTYNNIWRPAASANYTNAYTLENTFHSKNLDVQWLYGGRLTFDGGQGFTDWAFIPASSITDQSYARYKERKEMYAIYKELYDNDKVSTYSEALATANAVYTNASATKADLRAATRTLLIAVAEGIENPIRANALFTNADIHGNQVSTDWNVNLSTTGGNPQMGAYTCELLHSTATIKQTQTDLPNGLYDVVFHGLYRQDDGKSQDAPHLTVTGTNVLEDDLSLIGALQFQWAVSNGDRNSGKWTAAGVPDDRISAGQAQALGNAVTAINNVQVKGNSLTIQLAITGANQWVFFQGFDIIYNGPINVAVYKRLMAKKAEADAIVDLPMSDDVHTTLVGCIEVAEGLTANSDEDDLNTAYDNLVSAISDAEASIALTAHVNAIVNNKGDITSLINGTFDADADGWYGGSRVTTVKDRGWRGGNATIFYERTTAGTMSYTLSNMPAGTYKVVAAWRSINGGTMTPSIAGTNGSTVTGTGDAAPAVGTKEINMNGVEMPYSNLGGFTTNNSGHNWHWITATGTLAEDGNLVINFTTAGTAGWNAIDDVHLYCTSLGGTSYTTTVTEGSAVSNSDGKVVTCDIILSNPNSIVSSDEIITTAAGAHMYNNLVSGKIEQMMLYDGYTFSMSAGDYTINDSYGAAKFYRQFTEDQYCTVCLPFTPAIGTGTYYEPERFVDGVLTLSAVADKDLKPNTPYILKPAGSYSDLWNNNNGDNSEKYNVKYTGVRPATSISDDAMWFTGTYEKIDNIGSWSGTYYVLGTDNNLHKVAGEVSVNPFRAYFFISGESGARSTIRVNFDGTTGVENVEAVSEAAQKEGKFFKDGKLFIFKNGKKYNANGVQVK